MIIGSIVFGLLVGQTQVNAMPALVFTSGHDSPPKAALVSQYVKPGNHIGWKVADDGSFVYVSPRRMAYIFRSSVGKINNLHALKAFSQKLSGSEPSMKLTFGELPEDIQARLTKSLAQFDFEPDSELQLSATASTNVSAMGRSFAMQSVLHGAERSIRMKLTPIQEKAGAPQPGDLPSVATYQIYSLGLIFESDTSNLVKDAITEFDQEIGRQTIEIEKTLFDRFGSIQPIPDLKARIGQGVDLKADRDHVDPVTGAFAINLKLQRNRLGFSDDKDWDEFSQQAKIDSVGIGFNLSFSTLRDGREIHTSLSFLP
ncbi:MAG: hypothetical protein JST12_19855 [Armatimonadetes bacterium]|nr:hypothetical protein [Armatimonadota bacterium]